MRKHPSDLSKCSMIVTGLGSAGWGCCLMLSFTASFESGHLWLNKSFDHLWIFLYMREQKRLWHSNPSPFLSLAGQNTFAWKQVLIKMGCETKKKTKTNEQIACTFSDMTVWYFPLIFHLFKCLKKCSLLQPTDVPSAKHSRFAIHRHSRLLHCYHLNSFLP